MPKSLKSNRKLAADARAALCMIREAVEQHAPPGSVPSEEYVEPPFTKEADVLVKRHSDKPSTRVCG